MHGCVRACVRARARTCVYVSNHTPIHLHSPNPSPLSHTAFTAHSPAVHRRAHAGFPSSSRLPALPSSCLFARHVRKERLAECVDGMQRVLCVESLVLLESASGQEERGDGRWWWCSWGGRANSNISLHRVCWQSHLLFHIFSNTFGNDCAVKWRGTANRMVLSANLRLGIPVASVLYCCCLQTDR